MEPWGWILVYLAGFALFQLLLFRYVSDNEAFGGLSLESGETTGPQSVDPGHPVTETDRDRDVAEGVVHCPHCGAENADESHYTYCGNCLAQLR